jgi:gliding motility-associated-like protein
VTVRSGCNAQTASRTLTANLCVPNIITPNKDGRNDAFVVSSYNVGEWSVAIYNRWGKEVYKTERYLNDWGNSAAPGVYYYMLRRNATNSTLKGWVEVVR